jgi:tetratricopeptide (TPR) repeat protein
MRRAAKSNKMKRTFFCGWMIAFMLLSVAVLHAQSPAELYQQANQQYRQKQYASAAASYEKILSEGYKNAATYYNLGNCYYKLDSTGKSILNFERALKLAPDDEDVAYNLRLARSRAVDDSQPVPQLAIVTWWNNFRNANSSGQWALVSLGFIWAALIAFAMALFLGSRKVFNTVGLLLVFCSVSSLLFAAGQRSREQDANNAIVMVSSSYVKSAPDAGSGDLFMVHEGTRLQILDQVGEWNKIRLADGKVGWIEKQNFERI